MDLLKNRTKIAGIISIIFFSIGLSLSIMAFVHFLAGNINSLETCLSSVFIFVSFIFSLIGIIKAQNSKIGKILCIPGIVVFSLEFYFSAKSIYCLSRENKKPVAAVELNTNIIALNESVDFLIDKVDIITQYGEKDEYDKYTLNGNWTQTVHTYFYNNELLDGFAFHIGMKKSEVISILGDPNDDWYSDAFGYSSNRFIERFDNHYAYGIFFKCDENDRVYEISLYFEPLN